MKKQKNPAIKFKPKLTHWDIDYFLHGNEKAIKNSRIYSAAKKLASKAHPTFKDEYDTKWEYFYLPIRRRGTICVPLGLMKYRGEFFAFFRPSFKTIRISRGKEEAEDFYLDVFRETLRFLPLIKKHGTPLLERLVPYDIRAGKIKGRYVLEKPMSLKEKERLLSIYKQHMEKSLKLPSVSLNEYLEAAAVCYRAAFGKKTEGLKPAEMYKRWADGRDGGMLSIADKDGKEGFEQWHKKGGWTIGHPFEIVFSWHRHGIHLYPPSEDRPHFSLRVTNYAYAGAFLQMLEALIEKNIPFQANAIEDVLNYLTGETYFTVNEYDEHFIHYIPSREHRKLYFKHVEWEEIKLPSLK